MNRYAAVCCWRNPFGTLDAADTADVAQVSPSSLWQLLFDLPHPPPKLESPHAGAVRGAIQIVGRMGHGKSTRLRWIENELVSRWGRQAVALTYVPRWPPGVRVATAPVTMIDEAQRWFTGRRRHVDAVQWMVVASHWSIERRLRRLGFRVRTMTIDHQGNREVIAGMIRHRILLAKRSSSDPCPLAMLGDLVTPDRVDDLWRRHRGNLRACNEELYRIVEVKCRAPL